MRSLRKMLLSFTVENKMYILYYLSDFLVLGKARGALEGAPSFFKLYYMVQVCLELLLEHKWNSIGVGKMGWSSTFI